MADGGLKLELDEDLSSRLVAAAEVLGRPPAAYAAELIGDALEDEWSEAERAWKEYQETGKSISLDEAMDRIESNLKARFAAKRLAAKR
jgi:predicted transcriptional regulator